MKLDSMYVQKRKWSRSTSIPSDVAETRRAAICDPLSPIQCEVTAADWP